MFGFAATDPVQGTELPDIDFVALAKGQGCDGVRVERSEFWVLANDEIGPASAMTG